ncbi:MAG: hypothetical protein KBG80_06835 [Breznakibacter sp.]|jgi:hypothetical protein|nr:hypothetical protein [Breznakibacter sp.]
MIKLSEIDPKQEINRIKNDSYSLISNDSIPSEALIYGSLGILASGYQGITIWRQLRDDKENSNANTISNQ